MNIHSLVDFLTSKKVLMSIGGIIVALVVFQAGVFVGYRKATFSHRTGDAYFQVFGRPQHGFMMGMPMDNDFTNGHGAAGKIIKLDLPTFVVSGPDGVEKTIRIKSDTLIRRFRDEIKANDLALDDFTITLGAPNAAGEVEAKFIRILPPPPSFTSSTSTPR